METFLLGLLIILGNFQQQLHSYHTSFLTVSSMIYLRYVEN